MEVDEVTEFVKKILVKSEALAYCAQFGGISDEKFKSYSFEDLKCLLPSTEEGELAAAEIKAQIELALMMERVKSEKRAGGDVSSYFQTSATKNHAAGLDESGTGADGITVEIVPHESKEFEVVTLDSDEDDDQPQDNLKSCDSSDEDDSDSEYVSTSESSSESDESDADDGPPFPKRHARIELASTTERPVGARKAKIQPVLNLGSSRNSTHECRLPTKEGRSNQQWYDEVQGQHCRTINAYQWCWEPLNHRCESNLFRILCNAPNVEKLNLFNDAADTTAYNELPKGSLLKLKKLLLHRRRNMNIGNLLRTILKMATNLKGFEYKFSNDTEEDLGLLGDFDWCNLERLAVFSLSSPSYLTKAHLENLLRVRAPKLRKLEMGIGLYEDVSGDLLENVLKNFPTLQSLYIPGQYYSHADAHPAVTINFPKLSQLRFLNFGGQYYYPAIRTYLDESSALTTSSTSAKPFQVTLKFCRIFSRLKTLILGNMCHIDDLHLKCFPKLERFFVGSSWHLSVVFSEKNARNHSYPLITDLQFPDGLKDDSFVRSIPKRFPNVKICRLTLPSALVLRTFFNVMKDVGVKKLCLVTSFVFSSTLESCLLDKVLPVKTSSEDWKGVTELEKCAKWNELVDKHNIILPLRNDEEVQAFVEATGEYGLGAMKHLDKFYLQHVSKISCLPLRESSQAPTARTVKLGYKKYPISAECCDVVRRTATKFWWRNLEEPAGEREKWKQAGYWSSTDCSDEDLVETEAGSTMKSNIKEDKTE